MHWASSYIGKPWRLGAVGPDDFDCWGLVRHVQKTRYGRDLPAITADTAHAVINGVLRDSPWKQITVADARDGDVFMMRGGDGPHVGAVIEANGAVGCLHALGSVARPLSVVFTQQIDELSSLGFSRLQAFSYKNENL